MKKLILIAFAIFGSLCGYSQMIEYPKNQISVFYCDGMSLYSGLLKTWGSGPTNDGKKGDGEKRLKYTYFSGTYNVEYLHNFIKPWMSMGVQLGYEEIRSKHWINRYDSPSQPNDHWTVKEQTPYIIAAMQFDCYEAIGLVFTQRQELEHALLLQTQNMIQGRLMMILAGFLVLLVQPDWRSDHNSYAVFVN